MSLKSFRSARSMSKSTLTLSKKLSLHSVEEVAGDDGATVQVLEEGGEYVVLAAADEIEKCGSNLIISPESGIYLQDIFNENENENEKNLMRDSGSAGEEEEAPVVDDDGHDAIQLESINKQAYDQNVDIQSLKVGLN